MTSICARDLSVQLGGRWILQDVSIDVPPGAFVGIIGPNGSGKSTLLRCLYRVLRPTKGAVLLDGFPLESFTVRESAKKLAVVAQHHDAAFDFLVRDVVLMGRSPHKRLLEKDGDDDLRMIRESLALVGLEGFEDRSFSTLSGGEQQRVILARALAQQTPCLLLDEPTNHLDIRYQLQLMHLVRHLDKTVVMAVHDLQLAALYCDMLVAISNGRIAGAGRPEELLNPPFLLDIYGVRSDIVRDEQGRLRIFFLPPEGDRP